MLDFPLLYVEGIFDIANFILATVAVVLAILLIRRYPKREMKPFKILLGGLIIFMSIILISALGAFQVYENPYATHFLAGPVLWLMLFAIYKEIQLRKEPKKKRSKK